MVVLHNLTQRKLIGDHLLHKKVEIASDKADVESVKRRFHIKYYLHFCCHSFLTPHIDRESMLSRFFGNMPSSPLNSLLSHALLLTRKKRASESY